MGSHFDPPSGTCMRSTHLNGHSYQSVHHSFKSFVLKSFTYLCRWRNCDKKHVNLEVTLTFPKADHS